MEKQTGILVIQQECINCDVCEDGCPNTAISFDETIGYYQIDPEKCTFCHPTYDQPHCQAVCPVNCIELIEKDLI